MKICVASPYPLTDLKGNSVSTKRIVGILNESGYQARGSHGFDGESADVLISLHSYKGTQAVDDFRRQFPGGKVIVLITGTDLYVDLPEGRGISTLEKADVIVLPYEEARGEILKDFEDKLYVVPSSLTIPEIEATPQSDQFVITIVGHLRPVKRPFLTIEAVAAHPEWGNIEVRQLGEALDEKSADTACDWEEKDTRYQWLGALPREESLAICAGSSLTVNSSRSEAAANAVLEAMTLGVPILASRIEGNIGLLGVDYPGYFEGNFLEPKLAEVITGEYDLSEWVTHAKKRLPIFSRESERSAWDELLNSSLA